MVNIVMPKRLTIEDFINKAIQVHGEKYQYESIEYKNNKTKIRIFCKTHSEYFWQYPYLHLQGYNCPKCGKETWKSSFKRSLWENSEKRAALLDKRKKVMIDKYGVPYPSLSSDICEKREKTFLERYGGHPSRSVETCDKLRNTWKGKTKDDIACIMLKKKETFQCRYGYDNPFNSKEVKQRIAQLRTERGDWSSNRTEFEQYRLDVVRITEKNYRIHWQKINPLNLKRSRSGFHLDHIFSITEGFNNNVPPEIIGHYTNLRIIDASTNRSKYTSSHKTIKQLYEDAGFPLSD